MIASSPKANSERLRAYFTASIVGKKDYLDNYLTIIRYLESKKIKVIANHIINSAVDKIRPINFPGLKARGFLRQVYMSLLKTKMCIPSPTFRGSMYSFAFIPRRVRRGGVFSKTNIKRRDRIRLHARIHKWIETCDFVVAETSFPSISVGYEISLALNLRKPVLILYGNGDPPALFAHFKDSRLVCEKYTLDSLCNTIDSFINYIKGSKDTRFTFFITPNIAAHLERIQKEERMPKSVYLRHLIEKDMKEKE